MSSLLMKVVQLSNDRVPGDIADHWTVSLDGVLLLDSPIYGRALDLAIKCRHHPDELREAVERRARELTEQVVQAVNMNDQDDAADLGNELLRLRWTYARIAQSLQKEAA